MPTLIPQVRRRRKAAPKATTELKRQGTVSKWGNSLGVRIPHEAAERLKLKAGEQVSVEVNNDSIIIRAIRKRRSWSLDALLEGVRPESVGGEFPWGRPVGKERP